MKKGKLSPDFLIIGAQKSGTTALHAYLSLHPEIGGSNPKELHFFNSEHRYKKGAEYYMGHFRGINKAITFEASPSYLVNKDSAIRIFEFNPNIKLVAILRNPIERAYSAWNMYIKRFKENRSWFFNGWLANVDPDKKYRRRSDHRLFSFCEYLMEEVENSSNNDLPIEAPIIPHGYYYEQISSYINIFDRNNIFICTTSQLRNDAPRVLNSIASFVGAHPIDWGGFGLRPVFEGDYDVMIGMNEQKLLADLYRKDAEKLVSLCGLERDPEFSWLGKA